MLQVVDKHLCCGCEACVQICPKQCISFTEDEEGFKYPHVDKATCIDCGLCEQVCPFLHKVDPIKPEAIYAAQNLDKEEVYQSSSGGLFILLARKTIESGGVVFGARFDKEWNVKHSYTETFDGIRTFMGSKYVQSRIGNCYKEAKSFLESGRMVLFTGTSCQIAGLRNYLRKDYEQLLTADVICHGVPSPKIWQSYLNEITQNVRKGEKSVSSHLIHFLSGIDAGVCDYEINSISFRDKRLGWKKYSFSLTLAKSMADGKYNTVSLSHPYQQDLFMQLFLGDYISRPSCYNCPAKGGRSQSDLTIADYWGVEKIHPDFDKMGGVSLMICNTMKGKDYVVDLPIKLAPTELSDATKKNSVYYYSHPEPENRERFFYLFQQGKSLKELGYTFHIFQGWSEKAKSKFVRFLRKIKT